MRPSEAIEWIIELFKLTGHDVSEQVADAPGVVHRFATPRTGRDRARLYWEVWAVPPADGEAAMAALEGTRQRTGADRAVAIVLAGEGSAAVEQGMSIVQSLRRFAFDVAGVTERLRELAAEELDAIEIPATVDGRSVDPVAFICRWADLVPTRRLVLIGLQPSASSQEASRQQARRFLAEAAASATPILPVAALPDAIWLHLDRHRWLIANGKTGAGASASAVPLQLTEHLPGEASPDADAIICRLGMPDPSAVADWLRRRVSAAALRRWSDAMAEEPAFRIFGASVSRRAAALLAGLADAEGSTAEWITRYFVALLTRPDSDQTGITRMAPMVFEHFALGHSAHLAALPDEARTIATNPLMRDYHIAYHIAARFRAGDTDLVTRYRLPEKYVLLFLALLSPEAAARATADRTEELRQQIADEVEHQVQLTISHHLKRSVGAARAQFVRIERALTPEQRTRLSREIDRLYQELDYQHRLAERTRIYHEVPDTAAEDIDLIPTVRQVIDQLRQSHPAIRWHTEALPPSLFVRAQPDGLRDIVHNIAENAVHAALLGTAPRVTVTARAEAETVSLDIHNSGPAIAPGDRERIFDPRVTTKKGGDQPLGTGMGLPIARRYAAAVGGRVELDLNAAETGFSIRLVAARKKP